MLQRGHGQPRRVELVVVRRRSREQLGVVGLDAGPRLVFGGSGCIGRQLRIVGN
jgi:hypothetical protein